MLKWLVLCSLVLGASYWAFTSAENYKAANSQKPSKTPTLSYATGLFTIYVDAETGCEFVVATETTEIVRVTLTPRYSDAKTKTQVGCKAK